MKILAICGSPRKGNTEFMLNTVLDEITNHEKELILLRDKEIKLCSGCQHCEKEPYECVINDDMQKLNNKFMDADILVLGTPSYFSMMTGLMKNWVDRTNPLYFKKPLEKQVYILAVGAANEKSINAAAESLKVFCEIDGMDVNDIITAKADDPETIKNDQDIIQKLKILGKKINNL